MENVREFDARRAPYAPISALEQFFDRIRNRSVPEHVDQRFLQRLNVASNNEYALLSALKFLGIVDHRGRPTRAYGQLQTTDGFTDALRELVETAYAPLIDLGGLDWSNEDLVNYFRRASSPSQAKNAARFFRAVARLSGLEMKKAHPPLGAREPAGLTAVDQVIDSGDVDAGAEAEVESRVRPVSGSGRDIVLQAKAELMRKLPAPRQDWSAEEYREICSLYLQMLEHLDSLRG